MRTISDEQEKLIVDLIADGPSRISPAALEKDALVTEALRAISEVKLSGYDLTFSGGTCLAKAYGLAERMSEDIDLRLQIEDYDTLSRSAPRRSLPISRGSRPMLPSVPPSSSAIGSTVSERTLWQCCGVR